MYPARKQKTSTVFVRAPKHFNIGKQKVINLNYQTPDLILPVNAKLHLNTFLYKPQMLYAALNRRIKTNPALGVRSIRIRVVAKITLMWLETLCYLLS